jgi:hypothetical protein
MNTAVELADDATTVMPIDLMHQALISGASVEVMEKIMALQERAEANRARKAFSAAIADAKAEMPEIFKTNRVDFRSSKGHTQYSYEDLAEIANVIGPALSKHGLSFRWRTESSSPDVISVTCIISHRDGHMEETTLPGMPDISGNKNPIQAIGSAVTYLQRYTLKAALGLTVSKEEDDDARGAGPSKPVTGEQAQWTEWCTKFLADIDAQQTVDAVNEITNRNADQLAKLQAFNIPYHKRLIERIKEHVAKLSEEGT